MAKRRDKVKGNPRRSRRRGVKACEKEAVEKVLETSGNPSPNGIPSTAPKGDQEVIKANSYAPKDQNFEERVNKESNINRVHRRFGTSKEELKQLNVTTNHSCQEIPSQTHEDSGKIDELNEVNSKNLWSDEVEVLESQQVEEQVIGSNANKSTNQVQKTRNPGDATVNPSSCQIRVEDNSSSMMKQAEISIVRGQGTSKETGNQDGSAQASLSKRKGNGTVNPSKTGEILAFVDGVPVYSLEKGLDGNVPTEVRKESVCQEQQTVHGKEVDPNGTVTSGCIATVNPNLGSVYELQFKLMQENLGNLERTSEPHEVALTPYEPTEQAIVAREFGDLESLPVACASRTGSPMQIQFNVPLRTPNQVLHDIITHKELPDDIQHTLMDQQLQLEGKKMMSLQLKTLELLQGKEIYLLNQQLEVGRKGRKINLKSHNHLLEFCPGRQPLLQQDDDQDSYMEYMVC
ncbi:hypothetical protein A4A49_01709 [Nicotiana attenuata]|uniref:Uncharacterized protein n=1 Tax=Nicotiana attenuata TaxID=49451 RepID=A0A1J6ILT3_NICAT|nr:hypothetical protein A4A49_01709 [Nicotiana attenuata]